MLNLFLILLILILSVRNYDIISSSIIQVLEIFVYILVPSLFFMIIVSKLLKSNKLIITSMNHLGKILKPIFNFENESEAYILLFSLISGNPTSQILINSAYKSNEISCAEANRLSKYLCFSSPVYLYKTTMMLNPIALAPIMLTTYIIPLSFLALSSSNEKKNNTSQIKQANENLSDIISDSANSLFKICSFVFFFTALFNMLSHELNLSSKSSFFLSNFLDLTVSINHPYHFNIIINMALYIFFNTFLGLSIHLQIKSQAPHLKYKSFFINRLILSIISSIFVVLAYKLPFIFPLTIILVALIKIIKRSRIKSTST